MAVVVTGVEDDPVVRRAVFPVKVTLPDGSEVKLAKLIVTSGGVYVFINGDAQVIELVYEAPYTAATLPPSFSPRTDLYRVTTPDGELVATRLPGCGCHVRKLKNFMPWTPVRVVG